MFTSTATTSGLESDQPLIGDGGEKIGTKAPNWYEVRDKLENPEVSAREKQSRILYKYYNGRNILHWAFMHKAPDDVIELLIRYGGKEAVLATSNANWNPLHVACECRAKLDHIRRLIEVGGRGGEILSQKNVKGSKRGGMTPFDIACQYGSVEIVDLLVTEYDQRPSRDSVYYACGGEASTEMIKLLVNALKRQPTPTSRITSSTVSNSTESDESYYALRDSLLRPHTETNKAPLEILYQQKRQSLEAVLYIHEAIFSSSLGTKHISPETFQGLIQWIDAQTEEQRNELFQDGLTQDLLNQAFIKPRLIVFLMTDLYVQILATLVFSFGVEPERLHGNVSYTENESSSNMTIWFLCIVLMWLLSRELDQVIATPFKKYVSSYKNWLDILQIYGLSVSVGVLVRENELNKISGMHKTVMSITSGVVWYQLLFIIAHFWRGMYLFLAAIHTIIVRLIPFIVTTSIITMAFAHVYFMTNNLPERYCTSQDYLDGTDNSERWTCESHGTLYLYTFKKILSGNYMMDAQTSIQWVSFGFALIGGILLLNILIAEISEKYGEIREKAIVDLGKKRFDFVFEVNNSPLAALSEYAWKGMVRAFGDFLSLVTKKWEKKPNLSMSSFDETDFEHAHITEMTERGTHWKRPKRILFKTRKHRFDFDSLNVGTLLKNQHGFSDDERVFFRWYIGMWDGKEIHQKWSTIKRLKLFIRRSRIGDIVLPGVVFERVLHGPQLEEAEKNFPLYAYIQKAVVRIFLYLISPVLIFVLVCIYVLGFLTWGLLWPTFMKEFTFIDPYRNNNSEEVSSRRSLRATNKVLQDTIESLQHTITTLKEENEVMQKRSILKK